MSFRLLSYFPADGGAPRAGVLSGETVIDLAAGLAAADPDFAERHGVDPTATVSVLQAWDAALPALEKAAAAKVAEAWPLRQVKLAAPLLYPSNIFCAAANYQDHRTEMGGDILDKTKVRPYFFNKVVRQTVIGTGAEIKKPHITEKLDWEGEIGVVIGRAGRNIKAAAAMDHVAGYLIVNDLSARDYINRPDWPGMRSDWFFQKSFDTSCPMGPWLTPRGEVADPHNLKLNTWVNDTLEQDSHSKHMIFTVEEQIESISEHMTLLPGDVIATGTGSGVGHPKGKYLNPGDVVRIEIEGLGRLDNRVVAGE